MSEKRYYSVVLREVERKFMDASNGIVGRQISAADIAMSAEGAAVSHIPYIKDANESCENGAVNYDRLIIVGSSPAINNKVARHVVNKKTMMDIDERNEKLNMAEENLMEEDPDLFDDELLSDPIFDDYDEFQMSEECAETPAYVIELSSKQGALHVIGNPYIVPISLFNNPEDQVAIIFHGLDEKNDLNDKLDAILAANIKHKIICITPETYDSSWVRRLIVMNGFTPIFINDVPDEYYEEVLSGLLEDKKMQLDDCSAGLVVRCLRNKIGKEITEECLEQVVNNCWKKQTWGKTTEQLQPYLAGEKVPFRMQDMIPGLKSEESAMEVLKKMPGLEQPKSMFDDFIAVKQMSITHKELIKLHHNMIFSGNPGTGKTTFAKLMARAMKENGIVGAECVTATRSDIIGQYVGHTAPRVEALFKRARNGILFVDEAGFFLNEGAGGYVDEALKEFVRFMEDEDFQDVTVIFAMYEHEAAELLKLDEGLASRFSKIVHFDDYSDEELLGIFDLMIEKTGFRIEKNSHELVAAYVSRLKSDSNFANAREIRKIAESAIVSHCRRVTSKHASKRTGLITVDDVRTGILKINHKPAGRRVMGFQTGDTVNGAVLV